MDWDAAREIFNQIEGCGLSDADFLELRDEFVGAAVQYARLRADWQLANAEGRMQMDASRTSAHNRFIDACNILSRYMAGKGKSVSWRERLGSDRKEIGDFACYVHALLGVRAR